VNVKHMTDPQIRAALAAFWRKGRKAFVPMTAQEWRDRAGLTLDQCAALTAARLVKRTPFKLQKQTDEIFTITPKGVKKLEPVK